MGACIISISPISHASVLVEMATNYGSFTIELNEKAAQNRTTVSTFKNDTSSRSHAVCKISFVNKVYKDLEPGELYIFDLAGSENTADSQFHDKE